MAVADEYQTASELARRIAVGSILKFADASSGSTWTLVDVIEGVQYTTMRFRLEFGLHSITGSRVSEIIIRIEAPETKPR